MISLQYRTKKAEFNMPEIPSIPNPFPELCISPFTSVLSASLLPKANPRIKQVSIFLKKF